MLITNPPKNAFQITGDAISKIKPNFCPIMLVSQKRKVLINSEKSPKVIAMRGKVNNLIIGRRKALINPKMKASQRREIKSPLRRMPERKYTAR